MKRAGNGNFHFLLIVLLTGVDVSCMAYANESELAFRPSRGHGVGLVILIFAVVKVTSESKATSYSGYGLLVVWLAIHLPALVIRRVVADEAVPIWLDRTGDIANVIVIGWLLLQMVVALMSLRRVSSREVSASLCTYILLGVWFYAAYSLLSPNDFHPALSETELDDLHKQRTERPDLFYYSFVTLTSLGYGDVTPVSQTARSLSILEVVLGQFYLAVLIARQVGLYLMSRGTDDGE